MFDCLTTFQAFKNTSVNKNAFRKQIDGDLYYTLFAQCITLLANYVYLSTHTNIYPLKLPGAEQMSKAVDTEFPH
jgi:hypothetical protein